jgi:hypothetical protein
MQSSLTRSSLRLDLAQQALDLIFLLEFGEAVLDIVADHLHFGLAYRLAMR